MTDFSQAAVEDIILEGSDIAVLRVTVNDSPKTLSVALSSNPVTRHSGSGSSVWTYNLDGTPRHTHGLPRLVLRTKVRWSEPIVFVDPTGAYEGRKAKVMAYVSAGRIAVAVSTSTKPDVYDLDNLVIVDTATGRAVSPFGSALQFANAPKEIVEYVRVPIYNGHPSICAKPPGGTGVATLKLTYDEKGILSDVSIDRKNVERYQRTKFLDIP